MQAPSSLAAQAQGTQGIWVLFSADKVQCDSEVIALPLGSPIFLFAKQKDLQLFCSALLEP